jgi:hypothetical protein
MVEDSPKPVPAPDPFFVPNRKSADHTSPNEYTVDFWGLGDAYYSMMERE